MVTDSGDPRKNTLKVLVISSSMFLWKKERLEIGGLVEDLIKNLMSRSLKCSIYRENLFIPTSLKVCSLGTVKQNISGGRGDTLPYSTLTPTMLADKHLGPS